MSEWEHHFTLSQQKTELEQLASSKGQWFEVEDRGSPTTSSWYPDHVPVSKNLIPPGKDRWRNKLPLVLVYHGPLQIATFWGWLAIYFHYGVYWDGHHFIRPWNGEYWYWVWPKGNPHRTLNFWHDSPNRANRHVPQIATLRFHLIKNNTGKTCFLGWNLLRLASKILGESFGKTNG